MGRSLLNLNALVSEEVALGWYTSHYPQSHQVERSYRPSTEKLAVVLECYKLLTSSTSRMRVRSGR